MNPDGDVDELKASLAQSLNPLLVDQSTGRILDD
jgi:hypothetical protein